MAKPVLMTWWFPRQNSKSRERAGSHLTRRLIFAPCSCYRRSLPRTSQVAQVRPRVSPITKAGLRSHSTCQENFRAQSRSRTSPTLPKRWEREPSSAVWKGSYRKNLPKEVPKRLPHKNKNHQTLRKKRNKVPKTKSSRDCKNRSGSKHDAVLFGISPFWEKESWVNLDRSHTPPNPSS